MPKHNALFESEEKKKIAGLYFYCKGKKKKKKNNLSIFSETSVPRKISTTWSGQITESWSQ